MNLSVVNKDNEGLIANLEIKKREKENVVYSNKSVVNKNIKIELPQGDTFELLLTSAGYVPKKVIIDENSLTQVVILDKVEKNKIVAIDNIYFIINQSYILNESYDILDKLIAMMKDNPGINVQVMGHTDNTSNAGANQTLSEKRAISVMNYMVKNGIEKERITSIGFGSNKPVASNSTEEGRKKNRRTEFLIK